jgi:hypothetical protein
MTLRQAVPWENDDQEQKIRQWQRDLSWLQHHGYMDFQGPQRDFLRKLDILGNLPTDKDLLQDVYGLIQLFPSWLQELEQFILSAKEKVLVVEADELLQWTEEQLQVAVKDGKILSFTDEGWGISFEIIWDEQAQAFYDQGRHKRHFKSISGHLIIHMAKHIELIEP